MRLLLISLLLLSTIIASAHDGVATCSDNQLENSFLLALNTNDYADTEVFCSESGWEARVVSCRYDRTTKSIQVCLKIRNTETDAEDTNIKMTGALSEDGDSFDYLSNKGKYYYVFRKVYG